NGIGGLQAITGDADDGSFVGLDETAGGVTAGVTQKLIAQGRIKPDETTVVCITGNGLKTTDAIAAEFPATEAIAPRLDAFEAYLDAQLGATAAGVRA